MKTKPQRVNRPTFTLLQHLTTDHQCLKNWAAHVPKLLEECKQAPEVIDGSKTAEQLAVELLAKRQKDAFIASCPIPEGTLCAVLINGLVSEIEWEALAQFVISVAESESKDSVPAIVTGNARFFTERITVTKGAALMLERTEISEAIARHLEGDWGSVPQQDREENERCLTAGGRLMSAFGDGGKRVWVITEGDRSATTVLLPEEY